MKAYAILCMGLVSLVMALAQDASQTQVQAQTQDTSQVQVVATTPAPTVKYLNISSMIHTKTPMATSNITVKVRPDPRATEAPTPAPTLAPTPAPTPAPAPWVTITIDHDQVKPFAQPEPVTISERAGVKFKPQLHIINGCHSYPAVDVDGQTSGGLKIKGAPSAGCKGSGWGSQVYGRSTWYQGVWVIMYCWYFPKDEPSSGIGHRHDWEHVLLWIDNPEIKNPKILAVTPSAHSGYHKYAPPQANTIDGVTTKVAYHSKWPMDHALESTSEAGDFQDLIMWDQLSDKARQALNSVYWGKANTPMNDGNFMPKLGKAWPF
ncbi:unnamed protein product [Phytophthora lilii]|uniref:Unnamed protein product n=1 Tax=Phytophthora lilii TaxID=2077276 RepID=A0A9W6U1J0_9STRA|nr:unnamed protein product [Phytophthora lilii]